MNLVGGMPTAGTPSASRAIRMRRALPADRAFAMSLVPRLVAASPARWRNPRKACQAYGEAIEAILAATRSQSALLVGEREDTVPLCVVLLSAASNCYTHERQGHLTQIAVVEGPQASVDAIALIGATRAWARSHGYVVLMPDGFWVGHPATALCRWTAPSAEGLDASTVFPRETGQ